jgi:eukaryotic-like serine/threonine-protein kinase
VRRLPLVALLALVLVSAAPAAEMTIDAGCAPKWWPQSRQSSCSNGSATNTRAPSPANVAGLELAWTYRAVGAVGSPIVWAGPSMRVPYVYGVAADRRVHAVDLATGRVRWTAKAGGARGTVVADRDLLIQLGAWGGVLRRYTPRSGHIVWQRTLGGGDDRFPPRLVLADGMLYVPGDWGVSAVDARTGKRIWARYFENGAPEVAAAGGHVYVTGDPDMDGEGPVALHELDARTGHEVWSTRLTGPDWGAAPVLAGGRLFIRQAATRSGKWSFSIDAFRASDGDRLWEAPVGSHDGFWFTPPAATATLVVYASEDGWLYALDAENGSLRWKTQIGFSGSRPAIVNGLVWTGDGEGRLTALDAASGRRLWSSKSLVAGNDSAIEPVIAGDFVIVATPHGLLAYRLQARSGR